MALVNCPECGHEVSNAANACPNCGHPFEAPHVRNRVVAQTVEPQPQSDFPKWIFIPLGILGVVVLFALIMFMRQDDAAEQDINVNLARRQTIDSRETASRPADTPDRAAVPPADTSGSTASGSDSTSLPQTIPPDTQTTVTEDESPDQGIINIEAKIADRQGRPQPVADEKFYLLEKDLEVILREAGVKSIDGETLVNSFGLSVLNPDKYPDVRKRSLQAIERYVEYDATTDRSGKARLKDVKPGNYYLFGITRTDTGFAVWSSPVVINTGQNSLLLPPARLTEVSR